VKIQTWPSSWATAATSSSSVSALRKSFCRANSKTCRAPSLGATDTRRSFFGTTETTTVAWMARRAITIDGHLNLLRA
jgi:hypothetical protein